MAVPNLKLMEAVENLGYRVTVGDVAARTGLNVEETQQGLLALAADAGGHLQVAESGDIAYLFPQNFRTILQGKFWRLRWQKTSQQIWRVLFYLIRISFGILLILSLVLILVTIAVIVISLQSSQDGDSDRGGGDRGRSSVRFFWFPLNLGDWWMFYPDYSSPNRHQRSSSDLNFLEAIFSFLFGDGNPNAYLEERRWQAIASIIRSQQGAVVAEQIAPYLDDLGKGYDREYENYLLPVLVRFNGRPEVTPEGGIVYQFPDLQITATAEEEEKHASYLKEKKWRFSTASSTQIILAIGLGAANLIGALVLGSLLADGTVAAELGGLVAFVESIYGILLAYGIGFLAIPLGRYLWLGQANQKIEHRNQMRRDRRSLLHNPTPEIQQKLDYAKGLGKKQAIAPDDLAYTTETDILEQDINQLTDREDPQT
ncbi:hypothetical protein [Roseofilum capinflatum]|uniref:Iron-sulfur cluster biosynthesis family protein n=1 Tax=Roseofilum capinflatum BLCC-M114 TaxID=3022440 RepID=A0ABT7BBN7_9CYAN|nr:hypothetical protein [Roseofilum capinflatum]MDJ1176576.1 hypothetical protein [Roseofilum capinflatum BLCC-M114]